MEQDFALAVVTNPKGRPISSVLGDRVPLGVGCQVSTEVTKLTLKVS